MTKIVEVHVRQKNDPWNVFNKYTRFVGEKTAEVMVNEGRATYPDDPKMPEFDEKGNK